MTTLISFPTSRLLYFGSTGASRLITPRRRGIHNPFQRLFRTLGPVLGPAPLAVGHSRRVQRPPDHVITDTRKILDPASPDENDRVLLKIVPHAGNVCRDLHPVRQPHARDFPQSRVRLLGRRRIDPDAYAPLLRRAGQSRTLRLGLDRKSALTQQPAGAGEQ